MPLDRWISLYVAEPIIKSRLGKAKPGIPILMYDSIYKDPQIGFPHFYRLSTPLSISLETMHCPCTSSYCLLILAVAELMVGVKRAIKFATMEKRA